MIVREKLIANQMMKGPVNGRYAKGSSEESRRQFLDDHLELIQEFIRRGPRTSAAVGAVVCKCALKYDRERAMQFADALKSGTFQGTDDPVYLLWRYLQRKDQSTIQIYRTAVSAVRAYCRGKKLAILREARGDLSD